MFWCFRLGKLGAVFGSRQNYVQEPTIYASRPGLRLWQADKVGTVLKTLIFKVLKVITNAYAFILNHHYVLSNHEYS